MLLRSLKSPEKSKKDVKSKTAFQQQQQR